MGNLLHEAHARLAMNRHDGCDSAVTSVCDDAPPAACARHTCAALMERILMAISSAHCRALRGHPMQDTTYGFRVYVPLGYDQAVDAAKEALKQEGFGVLTTIDVRATLKEKLNVDFRRYVILGACNPPLAHRALQGEIDIGLLLPCNVVVYEDGPSTSVVAAVAPIAMIGIVGDKPDVAAVAHEAEERLRRALMSLERT
jgi:uncharacterized protein (DUF302 family)